MEQNKLISKINIILKQWEEKFPEVVQGDKIPLFYAIKIPKWLKNLPIIKIITPCMQSMSANIEKDILITIDKRVDKAIEQIEKFQMEVQFRQSTLLAQLAIVELKVNSLRSDLLELQNLPAAKCSKNTLKQEENKKTAPKIHLVESESIQPLHRWSPPSPLSTKEGDNHD